MQDETNQQPDQPSRVTRETLLVAIAILVLLPVLALVWHRMSSSSASAHTQAPAQTSTGSSIDELEAAVRSNPSAANRLNLSLAYINAGEPGRAPAVLQALLSAEPNNAAAWNNLCVAHIELHELQAGLDDCTHALAIDPKFQLAQNNLRWAQSERQAELDALAKMEQTPPGSRDAAYFLAQGVHYLHLANYDAAINSWRRVLLIDTKNASAANNIGTALMLKKQPVDAKVWFERAISWDPGMAIAKNNLAWAESELPQPRR
jgi:tetratricopeptide (TPR) repeat protein